MKQNDRVKCPSSTGEMKGIIISISRDVSGGERIMRVLWDNGETSYEIESELKRA